MTEREVLKHSYSFFSKFRLALPVLFGIILFGFLLFYNQADDYVLNQAVAQIVTVFTFSLTGFAAFCFYKKGMLDTERIIALLFICGFAVRLAYALRFNYNVHQHDVEGLNNNGHLSYIFSIASGKGLPKTNDWQFSHPPLHHFLSAAVFKFTQAIGGSITQGFENIQLLTVFYSTMTMFGGYKLLKLCKVTGIPLTVCCSLLSFHPTFQILAGSINNDILMIMLTLYGTVCLLKWYKKPSLKYALLCGLLFGLAMCTKVSAALFAVIAAVSVLFKFFTSKKIKFSTVLLHGLVFAAVFLPLGLWHPVRNYILFDQPLGYVAPIPVTNSLYTGDYSVFERLILPFSLDRVGLYVDVRAEYNIWTYLLRNSLFGEYNFGNTGIAMFTVACNLLLILATVIGFIYCLVSVKHMHKCLIPVMFMYVIQLAFFIYFNIRYPFGCSMDFRYIVPLLFGGIVFLGKGLQYTASSENFLLRKTAVGAEALAIIFSVCSVLIML